MKSISSFRSIRPGASAAAVLAVTALALVTAFTAGAATITKANNTTALNSGASWVSGTAPGAGDIATWDSTVTAANSSALGASATWQGISILSPGGAITITQAAGNVLGIGSSGIDLSAATQNLTLFNSANISGTIAIVASQTWNVAGGRTLTLFSNSNTANQCLTGSGNITIAGGGIVQLLTGDSSSTGFNAGGNDNYTGNWTVTSGTLEGLRNGTDAFGQGTITMNGGTLGEQQGNWAWANSIILNSGTTSTFDDYNTSSSTRYLQLEGVISGSGNLNINDSSGRMDANDGFILSGANTMSGTITVNANGHLRVGGVTGSTLSSAAGTGGTLGTASVDLNASTATLTFSRSNSLTVANNISGIGAVTIGGTGSGISGAGTQVLTLTGTNTYTGATTVTAGTLEFGQTLSLYNDSTGSWTASNLSVRSGATLAFNVGGAGGFATGDVTTLLTNLAASTSSTNGMNAGSILGFDTTNASGGVFTIADALVNTTGASGGARGLTKLGVNTLILSSTANTYTGPTNVSAGTLQITGTTNGTSGVTVGSSSVGTLTVSSGGNLTTTGTLALGSGIVGNVLNVNAGGVVNVGSISNSWQTNYVINGTLAASGAWVIATDATGAVSGSGAISVGSYNSTNYSVVNFTNTGSLTVSGAFITGSADSEAFNQSAGTVNLTSNAANAVKIASSGGVSSYALSGGTLNAVNSVTDLAYGGGGNGSLNVSGGTANMNGLNLNASASSTGTIILTGGTLNIGSGGITNSGAGTVSINLGAGTVGASGASWSSSMNMALSNTTTGVTFNTLDSVDNATPRAITLSGILSGAGNLSIIGTGTLGLTGNNTYTGTTTVNNGTLVVSGGISGNGSTTVSGGGTLVNLGTIGGSVAVSQGTIGGPGTISGNVVIGTGSGATGSSILWPSANSLAAANADNIMTIGNNVTFNSDGAFQFSLNSGGAFVGGFGTSDELAVNGTLTIASGAILSGLDVGNTTLPAGDEFLVAYAPNGIDGVFANAPDNSLIAIGSNMFQVNYTDSDTELVLTSAVPEPATWAALIGGMGFLMLIHRKRRNRFH